MTFFGTSGALGTTRTYLGSVASESAMLALTEANVGDWCKRSDLGSQIFELTTAGPAVLGNWTEYPAATSSGGTITVATVGDLDTLVAASGLSAGSWYYVTATGGSYLATSASEVSEVLTTTELPATTWAGRELINVTTGDTCRFTDIGPTPGTMFVWTGSRWRRLHPFTLASYAGSVASPVASLGTGVTSGTFTLSSVPTIPANLLEAGDAIMIDALVTHAGTGGTSNFNVHIGTAGTTSDSQAVNLNITAVNHRTLHARTEVSFSSATNFVSAAGVPTNDQTTATLVDKTTNVALTSAMYATVAIASGNAADSWKLIWFRLMVL